MPQDVYAGLVQAVGALQAAANSQGQQADLQLLAEAPQGALCWHGSEKAPVLLLAPWALQGGTTALLDRIAGLVALLPRPLQQLLGPESVLYAVACGDAHQLLADLPEQRVAWPALRGAAIRGWSLDAHGHSADEVPRLNPAWRSVAAALAYWQQALLDASAVIAAGPRNLLAERLGQRRPAGMGATAWVAAVMTALAALQLAWGLDNAPGILQMGAAPALGASGTRPDLHDLASLFSGSWLHAGVGSALVAAAALAFAQPLEAAIGPARWLTVWASAALMGTALGALGGTSPGIGAAAGTAAIVVAQLALARKLQVPLPSWGGLPSRWLWPALLGTLAATQWLSVSGVGALAAGAAVGALWGWTGGAAWGVAQEASVGGKAAGLAQRSASAAGWRSWSVRAGAAAALGFSAAGFALAWHAYSPWAAATPTGWHAVPLCRSGLTLELPATLAAPTCTESGGQFHALFGNGRRDMLTVSALVAPAAPELLTQAPPAQELAVRRRLAESTPWPQRVLGSSRLAVSGAVAVLQDQFDDRGPLPRVLSLRCGRWIDVQLSIAQGASAAWHQAAARIAASTGAVCPAGPGLAQRP